MRGRFEVLRIALAMLAILMASPTTAADSVRLSTAEAVELDADLTLVAREPGAFRVDAEATELSTTFENVTGRLSIITWTRYETPLGDPASPAPPANETFIVDDATVVLRVFGEPFQLQGLPLGEGQARVEGTRVVDVGRPSVATTPHHDQAQFTLLDHLERVRVSWPAGWALAAEDRQTGSVTWPLPPEPSLVLEGRVRFHIFGGTVEFMDADGRARRYVLGEEEPPVAGVAGPVQTRRLVFDGEVTRASVPLRETWAVAAPRLEWVLDGEVTWRRATGEATVGGATRAFEDATVFADFAGKGAPLPAATALSPDEHEVEGDLRSLRVDGAPAMAPARGALAAPAAASFAILGLALLTKTGQAILAWGAAALYSRIASSDLLAHPTRRRIVELVGSQTGLHMREIHRATGCAWGAFSFHLRLLQKGGYVKVVRESGYAVVVPAEGTTAPLVPHPVARAVLAELPLDGTPVDLAALVKRVGRARTVVVYHVDGLERRGLVERHPLPAGRVAVARRLAPTVAPSRIPVATP